MSNGVGDRFNRRSGRATRFQFLLKMFTGLTQVMCVAAVLRYEGGNGQMKGFGVPRACGEGRWVGVEHGLLQFWSVMDGEADSCFRFELMNAVETRSMAGFYAEFVNSGGGGAA